MKYAIKVISKHGTVSPEYKKTNRGWEALCVAVSDLNELYKCLPTDYGDYTYVVEEDKNENT